MAFLDFTGELQELLGEHLRIVDAEQTDPPGEVRARFLLWHPPDVTYDEVAALAALPEAARKRIEASTDFVFDSGFEYTATYETVREAVYGLNGAVVRPPLLRLHLAGSMGVRPVPIGRKPRVPGVTYFPPGGYR